MKAPVSRIGAKAKTTIPKAVRDLLGLRRGDLLRYRIEGERVVIERVDAETEAFPATVFHEWASEADEEAYGSL